ncbi:MAG: hypothetical protein N838_16325 [Thiohalocapsa sp. PB-PSB1]|nr:MAG: hypothetical protein N838_16325 [Thiohalocapsa sp. PB-PSB1]HCS91144.1 hypothetical protein [Chromatiaceae bacterium]
MRRSIPAMSPILLLTASLWTLGAAAAPPVQTFKDWALRCPDEVGCVLEQRVLLEDNDRTPLLHVALQYSGQPRSLNAILRVPLGVLLAPGLTLTLDAGAPQNIPFHHCLPEGCVGLIKISDSLAADLRRALTGQVSYRLADGRNLEIPLSPLGITAGLRALQRRP